MYYKNNPRLSRSLHNAIKCMQGFLQHLSLPIQICSNTLCSSSLLSVLEEISIAWQENNIDMCTCLDLGKYPFHGILARYPLYFTLAEKNARPSPR